MLPTRNERWSIGLATVLLASCVMSVPISKTGNRRDLLDDLLKEEEEPEEVYYDQRQNGTENYRLNINGVMFVIAPPEALINAAQMLNLGSDWDPELTEFEFEPSAYPTTSTTTTQRPPDDLEIAVSTHKPIVVPAPAPAVPETNPVPADGPKSAQRLRSKLRFPGSQFILPFIKRRPNN